MAQRICHILRSVQLELYWLRLIWCQQLNLCSGTHLSYIFYFTLVSVCLWSVCFISHPTLIPHGLDNDPHFDWFLFAKASTVSQETWLKMCGSVHPYWNLKMMQTASEITAGFISGIKILQCIKVCFEVIWENLTASCWTKSGLFKNDKIITLPTKNCLREMSLMKV